MRREKSKRTQQVVFTLFIVMIMTTSILGFIWGRDSEERMEYKDKTFTKQQNLWTTEINGQKKSFYYFPSQVEDIEVDADAISTIQNTPMLYVTYDPNQTTVNYIAQAIFDLDEEFSNYNIYSVKALTKENEFDLPIINCENATAYLPVIYFEQTNKTEISFSNNCITVEAKTGIDFLRTKDRLLYAFFGIIE